MNRERQIPSPIKGLQGQVLDFGVADDLHAVGRRRPRFGQQPRAPPHPALGQKAAQHRQAKAKYARDTIALRRRLMRFDLALNSDPLPMKDLPGPETGLRAGIRFPPSRRNVVFTRRRMYRCHPSLCIFFHSFGLLSPRSAVTITLIPLGMATDSRSSSSHVGSIHLPFLLAGMTTHATGMAHPRQTTLATMAQSRSESVVGSMASGEVAGLPQRQNPSHERGEAGADVYLIRGWRGAVGAVAEPLAESLADGGESAREVQGGDDGVPASAFGGYGSERPQGESLGLRLRETRHGLSQRLMNLIIFGWEAHGEPPASLLFFDTRKDAGKPRAFQVHKPVSGQTYPCKPFTGEGIRWLGFVLDFGRRAWRRQRSGFPLSRE